MKKAGNFLGILVMIIAGIILIVSPGTTLVTAAKILGIGMILYGVISAAVFFLQKNKENRSALTLIYSTTAAIIGIILLITPQFLIDIFPITAGVVIIISGIANLIQAYQLKKRGGTGWQISTILSLVTIVLGAILFANPFASMSTLVQIVGVIIVYNGIVALFAALKTK